ncbi:MAG: ABC transporter permease [Acinetobacter sp.]
MKHKLQKNMPIHMQKKTVLSFLMAYGSLMALALIIIVFSFAAPNFLSFSNLTLMLGQISVVGVIAFGATFVLILGGLDLSIMGIPGFIGSLVAVLLSKGIGNIPAIIIGLGAGALIGFLNGFFAVKLRVGIIYSGLAMAWIARGLDLWVSNYGPVFDGVRGNEAFLWLGQGKVGTIPTIFLILVTLFIVLHFTMTKTSFGRNMYAIGGSEDGAKACGINVNRYKMIGLCMSGLFSAIGGILLTAKAGGSMPRVGEGVWFNVLLAVLFGTTVATGGVPHILGTAIGVLFTGVLLNGFTQLNVHEFDQAVIQGILIVAAVFMGSLGGKMLKIDLK